MSMPKRAMPSSSSAGQPSQPKRPCFSPLDRGWNSSEANLMRCCCLTKEDVRSVCTEVLEHAKSDWAKSFESHVRNVLKDVVQQVLSENGFQRLEAVQSTESHSPNLGRGNGESTTNNGAGNLRLKLLNKLSLPLFTGKKIEGQGGGCISVALIDADTGETVTSGPESSIKLEVAVLDGDFNNNDEENWSPEEFENCVVKQRKGKGLLLAGNPVVKLREGVGELGELKFMDNSSWNGTKSFRIGVKVASGFCGKTRIREAITDAFPVKEHRGEAYSKHHPPESDDEVWRLENIAKNGKSHRKLSEAGVYNVGHFLVRLSTDPEELREILGKSITEKKWESLLRHAKTCTHHDGTMKHGAAINIDGQPIGLIQDRENFTTHRLSAQQKEHGDSIVEQALAKRNDAREFSIETFSESVQKSSSSSFSSQVFGGQIENGNPVQPHWAPPVSAAPTGPVAPLPNVSSTAEGQNGATALAFPVQSQNINSGNSVEISVDEIFCLTAQQPMSVDCLNTLISPEYHGSTTAGLPILSHAINFQDAMPSQMIGSSSQMDHTGYDYIQPFEPSYPSFSSFKYSWTLPLTMEDLQSINPVCLAERFDDGVVGGVGRSLKRWRKLSSVFKWVFYKKISTVQSTEWEGTFWQEHNHIRQAEDVMQKLGNEVRMKKEIINIHPDAYTHSSSL